MHGPGAIMSRKTVSVTEMAQGRLVYMLELARGGSHIASTRRPETLSLAITEVIGGFHLLHSHHATAIFRELLAQDLEARGYNSAASAVRDFLKK